MILCMISHGMYPGSAKILEAGNVRMCNFLQGLLTFRVWGEVTTACAGPMAG